MSAFLSWSLWTERAEGPVGIHTHMCTHKHTRTIVSMSVCSVLIITSYPLVFPYTQPTASVHWREWEMRDPSKCSLRLRLCGLHVLSLLPFVIPLLLSQPPPLIRILSLSFLRVPFFHLWERGEEEHGEGRRGEEEEGRNGWRKDEKRTTRSEWRSVVECGVWGEDEGACHVSSHKRTHTQAHTHTLRYTHNLAVVQQRHTVPLSRALKRRKCKGNEKEEWRTSK